MNSLVNIKPYLLLITSPVINYSYAEKLGEYGRPLFVAREASIIKSTDFGQQQCVSHLSVHLCETQEIIHFNRSVLSGDIFFEMGVEFIISPQPREAPPSPAVLRFTQAPPFSCSLMI